MPHDSLQPILIVDDSDDDVELFRIGLEEAQLANPIVVCRDGVQAMDYLLRRGEYDGREDVLPLVVLTDIKMPRMDGLDLVRAIRREPSLHLLPVVIMTSSNQHLDVEAGYAAGVNGFVTKPVGYEGLIACARAVGVYWGLFNQPAGRGGRT
ncbi:response regulator [Caenimonas terrae]|uniref:Response regulator n=1 Tax=Caenimonas terrae TaxID=696074 RepID=A0ABW0NB13_9BURK